ncbi:MULTISPECIES: sporulation protein Cse60 [Paenibacillus]|uniref:Sporulation protein Cse60 n=1 Tax=Paenibacillus ottowii TaxID=2315729 RepID=A0ABY3B789_9BACL|nr:MULTISPECIES: sporulation protein Cse60 [Paenibacillus]KZE68574.1 hypothetical protein AV545_02180 [Paenibacillus jamilae]NEU28104.1 sporulation protein Cse60 [Paenibacillus polymyxa]TQS00016.1 sporulation protein Cse60 [Paenibacillus ottowii]
MYQIKIFQSDNLAVLEEEANAYLSELSESIEVDIKYQIEHRSLTTLTAKPVACHTIILTMH